MHLLSLSSKGPNRKAVYLQSPGNMLFYWRLENGLCAVLLSTGTSKYSMLAYTVRIYCKIHTPHKQVTHISMSLLEDNTQINRARKTAVILQLVTKVIMARYRED